LLLAATALWRLPALSFGSAGATAAALLDSASVPPPSHGGALQMMVGFFAMSALLSVDWGAAVRSRGDIMRAGVPCVLAAAAWSSILSLLVVLETTAWMTSSGNPISPSRVDPMPFSFRWAVFEGRETFPPGAAAAILILFGLAALAAAVSSLNKLAEGVSTHWPAITVRGASALAALVALCLMATGQVDRLGPIFIAMGALFAPALGAMAGDLTGRIERGLEFRAGINLAGVLAWAAGCAVAVTLDAFTMLRGDHSAWLQQGSICGLLVSACVYRLLAASRTGRESSQGLASGCTPSPR
jgi:cytosine permease